jgi:hypothetical protein
VIAGATPVLVHNCGEASDELLDIADSSIGQTNVAAEAVATDGTRGFGTSQARDLEDLTPNVRTAVQATGHHGGCAEVGVLCDLERHGAPINELDHRRFMSQTEAKDTDTRCMGRIYRSVRHVRDCSIISKVGHYDGRRGFQ